MGWQEQQVRWQHVANIFGAIALLVGVTTLAMLLEPPGPGSPSTQTSVLIGVIGTVVGLGCLIIGFRSLRALRKRENLDAMLTRAAFDVPAEMRTAQTIRLGEAIARHFAMVAQRKPITPRSTRLTVGDVHDWLCGQLRTGANVSPRQFDFAIESVECVTARPASEVGLYDDLGDLVPRRDRRRFWLPLRAVSGGRLPRLGLSPLLGFVVGVVAVALTLGIMVPLAQAMDATHPGQVDQLPLPVRIVGRLLVRGGFFVLFAGFLFGLYLPLARVLPAFSKGLATPAALAPFMPRPIEPVEWTADIAWEHLQAIVGLVRGCDPSIVGRSDPV